MKITPRSNSPRRREGKRQWLSPAAGGVALSLLSQGCVEVISSAGPPPPSTDGGTSGQSLDGAVVAPNGDAGGPGGGGDGSGLAVGDGSSPSGGWINVTSNLAGIPAQCGSLTMVSAKPDEDLLIAGVANVGLYASRNGGGSWDPLGDDGGVSPILNRASAIVYDPTTSTRFWESGLYGASPFVTSDDGQTWTQLGMISHSDLIAVDFTDPARQTMLSGGHEDSQTLYLSTNGGTSWTSLGTALPTGTNCTEPLILDAQTFLVGCGGYPMGVPGILRSTNGGTSWTMVSGSGGVAAPLLASDGAIYWASANGAGLTRSLDQGMTWTDVLGPNVIAVAGPIELPGKRIAVQGLTAILVSSDQGATWTPATAPYPAAGANEFTHGLAYSTQRKALYIWNNVCPPAGALGPLPADSIYSYPFE